MEINTNNTKYMTITQKTLTNIKEIMCRTKEQKFEKVSAYECLKVKISKDEKTDQKIVNGIKKSTGIYYALNNTIFRKKEIETKVKFQVFNKVIVSTLLYGSETWRECHNDSRD